MRSVFSNVGCLIYIFKQGSKNHWNFGMLNGTDSASHGFVIRRGTSNGVFTLQHNGLSILGFVSSSNFVNTSDDRLKDNEELIESACETLSKLKPQTYDKKPSIENDDPTTWIKESGLIAQEVYYDAPELRHLVKRDKETDEEGNPLPEIPTSIDPQQDPDYSSWGNEPASLNYIGLIAYLVKANNELHERVKTLEAK